MNLFENLQGYKEGNILSDSERIKRYEAELRWAKRRLDDITSKDKKDWDEFDQGDYDYIVAKFGDELNIKESKIIKDEKDIEQIVESSNSNKLTQDEKNEILDFVLMSYETGHFPYKTRRDFLDDPENEFIDREAAWEFYEELVNLGPWEFYEEYKDELEFSEDYIMEYGIDDEE